jgi:hypothetical protein
MRNGLSSPTALNGAALFAAVIGLIAFLVLPWFSLGVRDRFSATYSGAAMALSLDELEADAGPDVLGLLDVIIDSADSLPLLPIPLMLMLAAGASLALLLQPRYTERLSRTIFARGSGTALLCLLWILLSDFGGFVQIGFWLVLATGVFLALESLIPLEMPIQPDPRATAVRPQIGGAPLAPAPFGIEPTMTFSMPTPAGFSAARPMGNLRPAVAWLVDVNNGTRYPVYSGSTSIGRLQNNDIVLEDLKVSREHALIQEDGGTFTLYDRASAHGTMINDRRLDGPEKLYNQARIQVGNVTLQFIQLEDFG